MTLRKKIKDTFSNESERIYYRDGLSASSSLTGKAQKPGGKLLSQYRSLTKGLRTSESKEVESEAADNLLGDNELVVDEPSNIKESLDWLKKCIEEPWNETIRHWEITAEYRRNLIGTSYNKKVCDIYEEWPILKVPKGYTLIQYDFELLNLCDKENKFFGFHEFYSKICKVKELRKSDYVDLLKEDLAQESTTDGK